jgi:hypothetical protein
VTRIPAALGCASSIARLVAVRAAIRAIERPDSHAIVAPGSPTVLRSRAHKGLSHACSPGELFTGAGQVLGTDGVFALEGTGSYAGWVFLGGWSDPMDGEPAEVHGLVCRSRAPDLDEPIAP